MDDRTRTLLTAPPAPLLVRLATPNAIAFLLQSVVSLAEVWFIGRLGTEALASIALVFPALMLVNGMAGGAFGGAVASAIARALGAGDRARADALIWHVLVLAAIGAALFLGMFLVAGKWMLVQLGGTGDVLEAAQAYTFILFSGGLSIWLLGMVGAIYRGTGNMQFPAYLQMANGIVQMALSGCLILGAFGFPQMGIVGAAVSTIVTASVTSLIMLVRLMGASQSVRLHFGAFNLQRALFADVLKVALPAALSPALTIGVVLSLTALVGQYGEAALAGYGIGSRIEFLLIPLVFGIGASMTSLVGLATGAKDIDRAERVALTGGAMATGLAGAVGFVLALFPGAWIPAFSADPGAIESATTYIRIVGPFFAFQGMGLSLYFASQGAGRMFWPIAVTVGRIFLAVGGALLLTEVLDFGIEGIYIAAATAMCFFGSAIALSVKFGAWRGR